MSGPAAEPLFSQEDVLRAEDRGFRFGLAWGVLVTLAVLGAPLWVAVRHIRSPEFHHEVEPVRTDRPPVPPGVL